MQEGRDWLFRFTPMQWVRAGLADLRTAAAAYAKGDKRGGLIGAKRGAGMALNAVIALGETGIIGAKIGWGRTYLDHLRALANDDSVPDAVRASARALFALQPAGSTLITLRSRDSSADAKSLEYARDVVAHAYACVVKSGEVWAPAKSEASRDA